MAAFNLTAQLNLVGPTNVKKIAADIRREIGTVQGSVEFRINPSTAVNASKLNIQLRKLNSTLVSIHRSARSASADISHLNSALGNTQISKISSQASQSAKSISDMGSTSKSVSKDFQAMGTELAEFGRQSGLAIRRFAAFSIVSSIVYKLNNALSGAITNFIDFDKELVRVAQVTGKDVEQLSGLVNEITKLSTSLGVTSEDLIQVSSTLAQAGLSASETEQALKALALSANAPSFDSLNDTVEGSIALMRQFGIKAKDLEKALGAINAVSAQFAVESSDIITAIQRTGGVFATASRGVSQGSDALNEFIAVFTSIRATTRESAETIATGLRTIFARIQRKDTIEALKQYGVILTDLEGKFVGPYEAVRRLSEGLSKLDPRNLEFSQIVEELGGFRQIGKVIPLIQQFATAEDALRVAQEGAGSLAADNAKAQLSLANKLTKVREEFVALVREFARNDAFQGFLNVTLSITTAILKLARAGKGLFPLLTIIGGLKAISGITEFAGGFAQGVKPKAANQQGGVAKNIGQNLGEVITGNKSEKNNIDLASIDALQKEISSLIPSIVQLATEIQSSIIELSANTAALSTNTASIEALTQAISSSNFGGGSTLNAGGIVRKFAKGGFVPGSGNSDSVPAMLTPGEFVMRKTAVNSIGKTNLQKMNVGGPINIETLSRRSDSGAKIKSFQKISNNYIENNDSVQANVTRKTLEDMGFEDKDYPIIKQRLVDEGVVFPIGSKDGSSRGKFDARSGSIVEEMLVQRMGKNAKKYPGVSGHSDISNAPIDIIENDNIYEVKFKSKSTSDNEILAKLLRYRLENADTLGDKKRPFASIGFKENTPQKTDDVNLGSVNLVHGADLKDVSGYKTDFISWLKSQGLYKLSLGGKIQKFSEGGIAQRRVGYIDYDVIANEANKAIVEKGMESTGQKGPRLYTDYLTQLAVKARKEKDVTKLRAVYGVAGSGKTTLARGQGTDDATLRKTERFPILSPEDIQKATEVIVLSSSVSKDKLDNLFSETDRTYALSSTTEKEQEIIESNRESRDITGIGLENRKPGSTRSVAKDSAVGEALLKDRLGRKAVVLGRTESGRLRRKSGNELVEIVKKKIGFTWGGFAPMTAGHESIMDAAAAMGISPEDFIYLVGANEGVDANSYRTAIFDQDARVLLAKAGAGAKGAMVLPKPRDFEVPQAFDISEPGKRRKVLVPEKGSTTFVADKGPEETKKYEDAGYRVKNLERARGISGTLVRDLIAQGDLAKLQSVLSPNVYDLISNNIGRIQNRANILPSIIEEVNKTQGVKLEQVEKEIQALGIARVDSKKVASDPEYAAKVEVLKELRAKRDKIKSAGSFEPYRLLAALAAKEPNKYGLDFSTPAATDIKPVRTVSRKIQKASLGGIIQRFMAGGIAEQVEAMTIEKAAKKGRAEIIDTLKKKRGGIDDTARAVGISAAEIYSILGVKNPDASTKTLQDAIRKEYVKTYNRQAGAAKGVETRLQNRGLEFAAAGMFNKGEKLGSVNDVIESDKLSSAPTVKIIRGVLNKNLAENLETMFMEGSKQLASKASEMVMTSDILQKFGLGRQLNLDFDRTLAIGADDILSDPSTPKFAEFGDRNKVAGALKTAKLTPLGSELIDLVKERSDLISYMRVITARPKSTLDLIQGWLSEKGLPIPLNQFTGLGGPTVSASQIADLKASLLEPGSLFVDDDPRNIQAATKRKSEGIESYQYGANLITPNINTESTIQGGLMEWVIQNLGGPGAVKGFGFDFPQGLGEAAKYFNIPDDIPTDVKRTISGPSTIKDNIITYLKNVMGYAKGGKVDYYSLEKNSGLGSREFDALVQYAKTNDFSLEEFQQYLKQRLTNKQQNSQLMMNPASLLRAITPEPARTTDVQRTLAEQLKGPVDAKYNPKYDNALKGYANGGLVPGTGNRDTVPAMLNAGDFVIRKSSVKKLGFASGGQVPALLTPGEYVVPKAQAQKIGYGTLNRINKLGKYNAGGTVGFIQNFADGTGTGGAKPAEIEISPEAEKEIKKLREEMANLWMMAGRKMGYAESGASMMEVQGMQLTAGARRAMYAANPAKSGEELAQRIETESGEPLRPKASEFFRGLSPQLAKNAELYEQGGFNAKYSQTGGVVDAFQTGRYGANDPKIRENMQKEVEQKLKRAEVELEKIAKLEEKISNIRKGGAKAAIENPKPVSTAQVVTPVPSETPKPIVQTTEPPKPPFKFNTPPPPSGIGGPPPFRPNMPPPPGGKPPGPPKFFTPPPPSQLVPMLKRQQAEAIGAKKAALATGGVTSGQEYEDLKFKYTKQAGRTMGLSRTVVERKNLKVGQQTQEEEKKQKEKETKARDTKVQQLSEKTKINTEILLIKAILDNTKTIRACYCKDVRGDTGAENTEELINSVNDLKQNVVTLDETVKEKNKAEATAAEQEAGTTEGKNPFEDDKITVPFVDMLDSLSNKAESAGNKLNAKFSDAAGNVTKFGLAAKGIADTVAQSAARTANGLASLNEQFVNTKIGSVFQGLSNFGGLLKGLVTTAALKTAAESAGGYETDIGTALNIGSSVTEFATSVGTATSAMGPLGTAVGTAVGALAGLAKGFYDLSQATEERRIKELEIAKDDSIQKATSDFEVFFSSLEPDVKDLQSGFQNLSDVIQQENDLIESSIRSAEKYSFGGFGPKVQLTGAELAAQSKEVAAGYSASANISKNILSQTMKAGNTNLAGTENILGADVFKKLTQRVAEGDASYQRSVTEAQRMYQEQINQGKPKLEAEKLYYNSVQSAKDAALKRAFTEQQVAQANEDFRKTVTDVRKRLEGTGVGILERIATNTPEENRDFTKNINAAQGLFAGDATAMQKMEQKAAEKAYATTGGSTLERQKAADQARSNVRKNVLSTANEFLQFGDQKNQEVRNLKAMMLETSLKSRGVDTNTGLAKQVLDSLRQTDPELQAQENMLQVQEQANKILEQIEANTEKLGTGEPPAPDEVRTQSPSRLEAITDTIMGNSTTLATLASGAASTGLNIASYMRDGRIAQALETGGTAAKAAQTGTTVAKAAGGLGYPGSMITARTAATATQASGFGLKAIGGILGKIAGPLALITGGVAGAMEAQDKNIGRTTTEGAIYGALTGGAKTGSVFSGMLGVEKGSTTDKALGVAGAAGVGALTGSAIGTMILPGIGTAVGAVAGAITGGAAEILKIFTEGGVSISDAIKNIGSAIWTGAGALPGLLYKYGSAALSTIWSGTKNLGSFMYQAGTAAIESLWSGIKALPEIIYSIGSTALSGIWAGLKELPGILYSTGTTALSLIWTGLTELPGFLYESAMSAFGMIWDGLSTVAPAVIDGVIFAFNNIGKFLGEAGYAAVTGIVQVFQGIPAFITETIPAALIDGGNALMDALVNFGGWAYDQFVRVFTNIGNAINDAVYGLVKSIGGESTAQYFGLKPTERPQVAAAAEKEAAVNKTFSRRSSQAAPVASYNNPFAGAGMGGATIFQSPSTANINSQNVASALAPNDPQAQKLINTAMMQQMTGGSAAQPKDQVVTLLQKIEENTRKSSSSNAIATKQIVQTNKAIPQKQDAIEETRQKVIDARNKTYTELSDMMDPTSAAHKEAKANVDNIEAQLKANGIDTTQGMAAKVIGSLRGTSTAQFAQQTETPKGVLPFSRLQKNITQPTTSYTSQAAVAPTEALIPVATKVLPQVARSTHALPLGSTIAMAQQAVPAAINAGETIAGKTGAGLGRIGTRIEATNLGRQFNEGRAIARTNIGSGANLKPTGITQRVGSLFERANQASLPQLGEETGGFAGRTKRLLQAGGEAIKGVADDAYLGFKGGRQGKIAGQASPAVAKATNLAGRLFQNKPMGLIADAVGATGNMIGGAATRVYGAGRSALQLGQSAASGVAGPVLEAVKQGGSFIGQSFGNVLGSGGLGLQLPKVAGAGALMSGAGKLAGKALGPLDLLVGGYLGYKDKKRDAADRGDLERTVLGTLTGSASTGGSMIGKMMGAQEGGMADVVIGGLEASAKGAMTGATIGGRFGLAIPGAAVGAVAGAGAEVYKAESARRREGAVFDAQMKESNRGRLLPQMNEQGDIVERAEGDKVKGSDFRNLSGMRLQLSQFAEGGKIGGKDLTTQFDQIDFSQASVRGEMQQVIDKAKMKYAQQKKENSGLFGSTDKYKEAESQLALLGGASNELTMAGDITAGRTSFKELTTKEQDKETKKIEAIREAATQKEADDLAARKSMSYEGKLAATVDDSGLNVRERLHLREAQGAQEELAQAQTGGDAEKIAKAQAKVQNIEEGRRQANIKETGKAESSKQLEAQLALVRSGAPPETAAATEYTSQQVTKPEVQAAKRKTFREHLAENSTVAGMSSGFAPSVFSANVLDQAKAEYDQIEAEKAKQQATPQGVSYNQAAQQMDQNLFGPASVAEKLQMGASGLAAIPTASIANMSQQLAGPSAGVITNVGTSRAAGTPEIGNVANMDPAAISEALSGTFNNFITALQNIQLPQIPEKIVMEGTHTVEVIINGAEALKSIDEGIRSMVTDKINEAMKKINNTTEGGFGPQ